MCFLFIHRRILESNSALAWLRHPLGWYPIHAAVLSDNPVIVNLILDQNGVDVGVQDNSHFTHASSPQDIDRRKDELCGGKLGNYDTQLATPLHYACKVGNIEIIRKIVGRGAMHNAVDTAGRVPLQYFDMSLVNSDVVNEYNKLFLKWERHDAQTAIS